MKPPFRLTPTARAAAAVCALWHNPRYLGELTYQINIFWIATQQDVL